MKILKKGGGGVVEKSGEEETKSMPRAPVGAIRNTSITPMGTPNRNSYLVFFHTRIGRITRFLIKHFGGK